MSITPDTFKQLADTAGDDLVSIYLPTHRAGPDIRQDPIRLKNRLQELDAMIEQRGLDADRLRPTLDAIAQLLDDQSFWRHQGEGLAIFAVPGDDGAADLRIFRLSHSVDEVALIGPRFCLRPLLPSVRQQDRFYTLVLSQNRVRLLECTRDSAREIDDHDIPKSLADAMGYDYEERSLQFHSVGATGAPATGGRPAVFHGQGRGNAEDDQAELEAFIHRAANALDSFLAGQRAPLVIAAVEEEAAMFRHASNYPVFVERTVAGNHDHRSDDEIHADALAAATSELDAEADEAKRRLAELAHTDTVSTDLREVLPAAETGRVGKLFLSTAQPIWGRFDAGSSNIERHDARQPGDEDLLDHAIAAAMKTGADVIAADTDDLPGDTAVAAVLRF